MERRQQLGNVAFGGDWSEAIMPREEVQAAIRTITHAVDICMEEDPVPPPFLPPLILWRGLRAATCCGLPFSRAARSQIPACANRNSGGCLR